LLPLRVGPVLQEGTLQTPLPTVKTVRMGPLVDMRQLRASRAKTGNTVHLPQQSVLIALKEPSRSSQMTHVPIVQMVSGVRWHQLHAWIVNQDAFVAIRLAVPVVLPEPAVVKQPLSAKNVLKDGSAEMLRPRAKFVQLDGSARHSLVIVVHVLPEVSVQLNHHSAACVQRAPRAKPKRGAAHIVHWER